MFFLPNTTSFAWSVLMPVWEWQADELPPPTLENALQDWFDEAPAAGDTGALTSGDNPAGDAAEAPPHGQAVLEAVALALAALPWQAAQDTPQEAPADAAADSRSEDRVQGAPPAATALPVPAPAPSPAPAPAPLAAFVPVPVPAAAAAPLEAAASARKPARPAATPAVPPAPTGRWVLAGWRDLPSYSLLRNVAAERVAEQPGAEDMEHTLSKERQRRHPGCGQP